MIGYDAFDINRQIALDLTLEEMVGAVAYDRSPFAHNCTLVGAPAWAALGNGYPYLEFVETNPDYLDCLGASTTELNYVAGDFTVGAWVHIDSLAAISTILCRGLASADGWYFQVLADGSINISTNQAGAEQVSISTVGIIVINTWYLVMATRSGDTVVPYNNGAAVPDTVGTHIDPLTSARELHVGIYDDEVATPMRGRITRPRIWSRLLSAAEIVRLWDMEKGWFGY